MEENITKVCSNCKTVKSIQFFHKNKSNKTGLASNCKDCVKLHRKNNINIHNYDKNYRQYNKIKINKQRNLRQKVRLKYDTQFKIKCNLRRKLNKLIRNKNIRFSNCNILEIKQHLERLFKIGMTWDNYGKDWHIDHIIPCSFFDLTDKIEQIQCFSYLNLQPLWWYENLHKKNKTTGLNLLFSDNTPFI